jgi:dipeptidyl aminopeptidase/acylaminoacyl peptidase
VNLTKSAGSHDEDPAWSPDGTKIALQSDGQIGVMPADGSNLKLLTSKGLNVSPAWSPDGRKIAFATNRDGDWEIYVMNVDGTREENLTKSSKDSSDVVWPAADVDPAWSPDGKLIAFTTNRKGISAIHVMSRDGSEVELLTRLDHYSTTPDWKFEPTNFTELRRHVRSGVLRIQVSGDCYRSGTGLVVGANLVVTADHVLDDATKVVLWRAKQLIGSATIVGRDPPNDLALLRADVRIGGYRFTFATESNPLREDEQAVALGYYPGTSSVAKLEGKIQQPRGRRVTFDRNVPPGFSGGPLVRGPGGVFGDDGAVLGVVVETSKEGEQTRAIPASLVQRRVDEWKLRRKTVSPARCAGS